MDWNSGNDKRQKWPPLQTETNPCGSQSFLGNGLIAHIFFLIFKLKLD